MLEHYDSLKFSKLIFGLQKKYIANLRAEKSNYLGKCFATLVAVIFTSSVLSSSPIAAAGLAKSWRFTCYAFRDVNRNGIFDLGDRPFAGLQIAMTRPNGSLISSKSNINGFTPFNVSTANLKNTAVMKSGNYKVRAKAPIGFTFTAPLDKQEIDFIEQSNARGGLVPIELCSPIGVAPILSIGGKLLPEEGSSLSDFALVAILNNQQEFTINYDESGNYSFAAKKGNWRLEVRNSENEAILKRVFEVTDLPVRLSTINLSKKPRNRGEGKISTLGFDDLLVSDTLFEVPSGYGGLGWVNWIATHSQFYKGAGYVNLTTSSEYMAYNSSGMPSQTTSKEPFDFVGTNVGVAWPQGEKEDVIFRAWNGNDLIYEDRITPSNKTPVSFDASYYGITRLEIRSGNYERVVIDDFQYRK